VQAKTKKKFSLICTHSHQKDAHMAMKLHMRVISTDVELVTHYDTLVSESAYCFHIIDIS
jgi:hypothetical protein